MSRFDGWLVRYIVQDASGTLTIKAAAKRASIRPQAFAQALRNADEIRRDAVDMGIDLDDMLLFRYWQKQQEADENEQDSKVASGASAKDFHADGLRRIPQSHKYRGSNTLLGVTCPNPGGSRNRRDELGCPITPIEHPQPQGEWHNGLNACGRGARGWR